MIIRKPYMIARRRAAEMRARELQRKEVPIGTIRSNVSVVIGNSPSDKRASVVKRVKR